MKIESLSFCTLMSGAERMAKKYKNETPCRGKPTPLPDV
jgi:hypothetical protein